VTCTSTLHVKSSNQPTLLRHIAGSLQPATSSSYPDTRALYQLEYQRCNCKQKIATVLLGAGLVCFLYSAQQRCEPKACNTVQQGTY
jgi:hypothetical protein